MQPVFMNTTTTLSKQGKKEKKIQTQYKNRNHKEEE